MTYSEVQAKCQDLHFPWSSELYNITCKLASTDQVKTALFIFFLCRFLTAVSAAIHSSLQRAVAFSHREGKKFHNIPVLSSSLFLRYYLTVAMVLSNALLPG